MEKIIKTEIKNSEIFQSSAYGGIQGEASSRALEITFDSDWADLSKTVTFFDGEMKNSVKILLNNLTIQKNGTHLVYIPAEALKTGGQLTFIIDGEKDGRLLRSVKKTLKVKYAPDTASSGEQAELTPGVSAQLALSIQKNTDEINSVKEALAVKDGEISTLEEKIAFQEKKQTETEESIAVLREEKASVSRVQAAETALGSCEADLYTLRLEQSAKADKTIIEYFGLSDGDITLGNIYNKEARFTSISPSYLNFIIKDGVYEQDYIAGVSFVTADTPPEVSYTNSGIINWVGCDCSFSDGYSLFIPSANMCYDIVFYFNGYQFIGLVNGYKAAIGNVVSE